MTQPTRRSGRSTRPSSRPRSRGLGQAIAEFAILLPILMFIILGSVETGFLVVAKAEQDRNTAVVATYAAGRADDDSWHSIAEQVLKGCDVEVASPHPGLIQVASTCHYEPKATRGLWWDGLPISSDEYAAVTASPSPSLSLSPSPSPSPEP